MYGHQELLANCTDEDVDIIRETLEEVPYSCFSLVSTDLGSECSSWQIRTNFPNGRYGTLYAIF